MRIPNLTNYDEHPTEEGWLVFRFARQDMADEFARELRQAGIRHEQDTDGGPPFMVAARSSQREAAVRLNYTVLGRHRSPFISSKGLRWALIALLAALIALAMAGALLNRGG